MEHVRLFIAIGLSLLVFIVWNVLFVDKEKTKLPQQAIKTEQQSKKTSGITEKPKTPKRSPPLKNPNTFKRKCFRAG